MKNSYAFTIQTSGDEAAEFKQEFAKAFEKANIALPGSDLWQFEGPPPGAFGMGEGILGFLNEAWRELAKVPGAVLAVAEGIRTWLEHRPGTIIEKPTHTGEWIKIKGNMTGNEIAEVLRQIKR